MLRQIDVVYCVPRKFVPRHLKDDRVVIGGNLSEVEIWMGKRAFLLTKMSTKSATQSRLSENVTPQLLDSPSVARASTLPF